jgi:hypothetical protein
VPCTMNSSVYAVLADIDNLVEGPIVDFKFTNDPSIVFEAPYLDSTVVGSMSCTSVAFCRATAEARLLALLLHAVESILSPLGS